MPMRNITSNLSQIFTLALFAVLGACSSVPQDETSAERDMQQVQSQQAAYRAQETQPDVPEAINQQLLDSALLGARAQTFSAKEPRFDVSVNEVPARTFFVSMIADSGVNVVAHPEISGSITLELKDVSVREVLNVTRDVYGYEYKFQDGIYTVYPRKLRTQVFPINYLDIQRAGVTETSVAIGRIESGSRRNNNSNNTSNNSSSNSDSESGAGENENNSSATKFVPGTRLRTLSRTDFWRSVQDTISAIVGGDADGRMVMVNPQAGMVVVKAMPNELSAVRDFLERSELSVRRQVVLETKIIEVQLNDGYEAGVNWGAITGALGVASDSSLVMTNNDGVKSKIRTTQNLLSGVLNVTRIEDLLNLLETQGNVQVLSSPRISTVNNQKAIIRVGTDEFFVTGITNNTTTTASNIQNSPEVLLDSFFSGIALDVTPQIAEDGDVIIHVHPLVSKVQDQLKDISIGDLDYSLPLALRDVRESDSIVRASNGQVVVLGGLMQETTSDVATKRPFLGDIPGVNVLFKGRAKRKVKTELVILMRPIVVDENTWEEQVNRSDRAIEAMSNAYRNRNQ
ncbi:MSHA type biogenesis protein, MshL [Teredinibacter turnerae T7901]|uniref:MSHA type biogenesis protein, MshL n=1 Tax=Teredinibacter turnerae (strain ATCC 39867 / T7901) TaxID=377629 RepID=C5BR23_TERTT|nr:MSHA type biogenesis protein, MshL [Teredinibacter turnerae T7901]